MVNSDLPKNLIHCDPHQRHFPIEWKESYFRRNFNNEKSGYVCPDCKLVFKGVSGFGQLQADHILPFSRGGLTVWKNMTLRCKKCNIAKSNTVNHVSIAQPIVPADAKNTAPLNPSVG